MSASVSVIAIALAFAIVGMALVFVVLSRHEKRRKWQCWGVGCTGDRLAGSKWCAECIQRRRGENHR